MGWHRAYKQIPVPTHEKKKFGDRQDRKKRPNIMNERGNKVT